MTDSLCIAVTSSIGLEAGLACEFPGDKADRRRMLDEFRLKVDCRTTDGAAEASVSASIASTSSPAAAPSELDEEEEEEDDEDGEVDLPPV